MHGCGGVEACEVVGGHVDHRLLVSPQDRVRRAVRRAHRVTSFRRWRWLAAQSYLSISKLSTCQLMAPARHQWALHYLHRADLLSRRVADQQLGQQVGTCWAMFLVLDMLEYSGPGGVTQQAIADHLGLTKAAVSRHIATARALGLASRTALLPPHAGRTASPLPQQGGNW